MRYKYTDNKVLRRCRGISIIEVAMASALLIVAMVPVLKNLTRAHQFSNEMERKTNSLILAQDKIDEIRAGAIYSWGTFTASNVSVGSSYLCNITDNVNATLKTITVSVGFDQNGDGTLAAGEVEVTLATYIARRW